MKEKARGEWLVDPETGTARRMGKRTWIQYLRNGSALNSYVQTALKVRTIVLAVAAILASIWGGVLAINRTVLVPQIREVAEQVAQPLAEKLVSHEKDVERLREQYVTEDELKVALDQAARERDANAARLEAILVRVEQRVDELYRLEMGGRR